MTSIPTISFFNFALLSALLFSTPVFAVADRPTNIPTASTEQAITVATVSIADARIVSQEDNKLTLAFTLSNRERLQTGVRYGVMLVDESGATQVLVDEVVYDESLTLAEHSTLNKEIVYTAPTVLSGTYSVLITSKNASGFPFGISLAGTVTLTANESGIQIIPETCFVENGTDGIGQSILTGIVLAVGGNLRLSCAVVNMTTAAATVVPVFETRLNSAYGALAPEEGGDMTPILLLAGEKKTVFFTVPHATKPQTYSTTTRLEGAGMQSNAITLVYTIPGITTALANVSLDKDYYSKGETAVLSLVWAGTLSAMSVDTTLKSQSGRHCAKPLSTKVLLKAGSPFSEISIPITANCYNPHLTVTVKGAEGVVFDEQEYVYETTSVPAPRMPWQTIALIVGGIIILSGGALYLRKRIQSKNHETHN